MGVVAFVGIGVTLAGLYQFGPPGIRTGETRILSSVILTNGSSIHVAAHKTGHWIDAFSVNLYRVEGTNISRYYLGHEEAFWWGCSLRPRPAQDQLDIQAFGQTIAVYSIGADAIHWTDKSRPSSPPQQEADGSVLALIARAQKDLLARR